VLGRTKLASIISLANGILFSALMQDVDKIGALFPSRFSLELVDFLNSGLIRLFFTISALLFALTWSDVPDIQLFEEVVTTPPLGGDANEQKLDWTGDNVFMSVVDFALDKHDAANLGTERIQKQF